MRRGPAGLIAIGIYLIAMTGGNLVWETVQLPLYTIWRTGTPAEITSAVLHCTAGDVLIAAATWAIALASFGFPAWPRERFPRVAGTMVALGIGYTVFSEYMNTVVWQSWAYAEMMPRLSWIGTGL